MKKSILAFAAVMFVAGTILSSCKSNATKVENAEEKVENAKDDLSKTQQVAESDFQKFKNESNDEINNNEKRIADLRIEMKSEKSNARARDEKKIDALEAKNHEIKVKLEAYHDDGKNDWREFKTEVKHDLDGVGEAFKDITVRNTK